MSPKKFLIKIAVIEEIAVTNLEYRRLAAKNQYSLSQVIHVMAAKEKNQQLFLAKDCPNVKNA